MTLPGPFSNPVLHVVSIDTFPFENHKKFLLHSQKCYVSQSLTKKMSESQTKAGNQEKLKKFENLKNLKI